MCPLPWMIFGSTNKFRVIIENIRRMADNEIFCRPFVFLIYTCKYSFTASKHGHPFIGFKSRCPTINAFGNCLRNSLNKASNESLLLQGTSILRLSFRIQPAFVANTYRMCVMVPAVCPNLFKRPSPINLSVTCDIEMITDVTKSPVVDMV